jgi:hypothetical protein
MKKSASSNGIENRCLMMNLDKVERANATKRRPP